MGAGASAMNGAPVNGGGTNGKASFTPRDVELLISERDRAQLQTAEQRGKLLDLATESPQSLAAALSCYIPTYVPAEEHVAGWSGADRAMTHLLGLLQERYSDGESGKSSFELGTVARATVEWHVEYYFNTPIVKEVGGADPYAVAAGEATPRGRGADPWGNRYTSRRPSNRRRGSYPPAPAWPTPPVPQSKPVVTLSEKSSKAANELLAFLMMDAAMQQLGATERPRPLPTIMPKMAAYPPPPPRRLVPTQSKIDLYFNTPLVTADD